MQHSTSVSLAQMQLGLKAGVNFANLSGDDALKDLNRKLDLQAGVFFMYQFNKMFAIQPEAYYSMKGATDSETFEGVNY